MLALPAPLPWYRQLWPWLVIAPPAAAVIAGIVTIFIAVRGADGLVAADYYKRGLAINEELARSRMAQALGLDASLRMDGVAAGDRVRIELGGAQALPAEAFVTLRLVHPARSGDDRVLTLARVSIDGNGRHAAYAGEFRDGGGDAGRTAWRLVVEGRGWRLDGDLSIGSGERTARMSAR
jgi:hypothetical protein